jgi:hypothetical protein
MHSSGIIQMLLSANLHLKMNIIRSIGSLLICSFLCGFCSVMSNAQKSVPPLERKVSLDYRSEKAQHVLVEIERQTGISFSYSSQLVPADKSVSVSVINRPVREALDKMFSGNLTYKTSSQRSSRDMLKIPGESR